LGVLGAAVALVALAVGAIGPARGAARDKDKQTTFTVEALTTEQNFEGTALGDQIVLTTQLLKGDTEVGHQGGVCTVTSVERNEAQCVATYSFRGGQITAQALIILGDPAPYAAAITGGSGKYQGVEGEVRVDPASETQPRGILTFHLQDRSARNRQSWEGQGVSPALPAATRQPSAPPLRWAHNY
jgi:hypothetical protein